MKVPVRWLLAVALLATRPVAAADPPRPVLPVAPPARDKDHAVRRQLAEAVAGEVARQRGGHLASRAPAPDRAPLARARARFEAGALDEAASILDLAASSAARSPDAAGDPTPIVDALVVRAAIALAQGEAARADELFGRLLRWDPGFALAPAEASPRLEAAAARVRAALGGQPMLKGEDLGEACARAPTLIVVRRLDAATLEVARWEDCRLAARATAAPGTSPATLAATLTPIPPPPPPPARVTRDSRWWLWGAIGAGVLATAVGGYLIFGDSGGDQVDVRPIL